MSQANALKLVGLASFYMTGSLLSPPGLIENQRPLRLLREVHLPGSLKFIPVPKYEPAAGPPWQ